MEKLIEMLVQNSPGVAACVVIVVLFLKAQKQFVDQLRKLADSCHERASDENKVNREHVTRMLERVEKLEDRYFEGLNTISTALGKNGEILIRVEKAIKGGRRRGIDYAIPLTDKPGETSS